jgi:hypothetical protein
MTFLHVRTTDVWAAWCPHRLPAQSPDRRECSLRVFTKIVAVPRGGASAADRNPDKMRVRRQTVEHPFGTIKSWIGATQRSSTSAPKWCQLSLILELTNRLKRGSKNAGIKHAEPTERPMPQHCSYVFPMERNSERQPPYKFSQSSFRTYVDVAARLHLSEIIFIFRR